MKQRKEKKLRRGHVKQVGMRGSKEKGDRKRKGNKGKEAPNRMRAGEIESKEQRADGNVIYG